MGMMCRELNKESVKRNFDTLYEIEVRKGLPDEPSSEISGSYQTNLKRCNSKRFFGQTH